MTPAANAVNAPVLRRAARHETLTLIALAMPALLLIAVLVVLPIGWLSWLSLFDDAGRLTAANYLRFFEQPAYIRTFVTTFEVALTVTGLTVLLGYPLSYMLSLLPGRIASFALIFVILPFWTSVLVRTYAWLVILQRKGLINQWLGDMGIISSPLSLTNNFAGVVIAMTHIMIPFLVLPLYASMRTIDRSYIRASLSLGASPTVTFWKVFLPLSTPGLISGVVLVFVLCLGFYVTPALLGGGKVIMWSMRMDQSVSLYSSWGAGSALGVMLLVTTLGLLALFQLVLGRRARRWAGAE